MIETRGAELRYQPGRRLVGTPMVYRREARVTLRDGRAVTERFAAFAFSDYLRSGAATRLNMMHDPSIVVASTGPLPGRGKLELRDTPDDLKMIATLPSGDPYDRVLDLVRDGSAAELSVEFRSLEQRIEGDRRTVLQATLPAVGIVDRGAYPQPVEVRARGRGLVGRPEYNRPRVTSDRGTTPTRATRETSRRCWKPKPSRRECCRSLGFRLLTWYRTPSGWNQTTRILT